MDDGSLRPFANTDTWPTIIWPRKCEWSSPFSRGSLCCRSYTWYQTALSSPPGKVRTCGHVRRQGGKVEYLQGVRSIKLTHSEPVQLTQFVSLNLIFRMDKTTEAAATHHVKRMESLAPPRWAVRLTTDSVSVDCRAQVKTPSHPFRWIMWSKTVALLHISTVHRKSPAVKNASWRCFSCAASGVLVHCHSQVIGASCASLRG